MPVAGSLISSSPASSDDVDDLTYSYRRKRRDCCFCVSPSWWQRISPDAAARHRGWWKRGWKSVVEWSRRRRFNRRADQGGSRHVNFRYDPLSYAMNFDQGPGQYEYDQDQLGRDFSCRYASFSRDYGGVDDGTDFT